MVIPNHELVGGALTLVRDTVRLVVEGIRRGHFSAQWWTTSPGNCRTRIGTRARTTWPSCLEAWTPPGHRPSSQSARHRTGNACPGCRPRRQPFCRNIRGQRDIPPTDRLGLVVCNVPLPKPPETRDRPVPRTERWGGGSVRGRGTSSHRRPPPPCPLASGQAGLRCDGNLVTVGEWLHLRPISMLRSNPAFTGLGAIVEPAKVDQFASARPWASL